MTTVWIILVALIGLFTSAYIFYKKSRNEQLVCVIGKDCNKVLNSKYNRVFGLPNEVVGIGYYFLTAILAGLIVLGGFSQPFGISIHFILLGTAFFAAVFSAAMLYIQGVILKEWCEYCLVSAGASIVIFLLEFYG